MPVQQLSDILFIIRLKMHQKIDRGHLNCCTTLLTVGGLSKLTSLVGDQVKANQTVTGCGASLLPSCLAPVIILAPDSRPRCKNAADISPSFLGVSAPASANPSHARRVSTKGTRALPPRATIQALPAQWQYPYCGCSMGWPSGLGAGEPSWRHPDLYRVLWSDEALKRPEYS